MLDASIKAMGSAPATLAAQRSFGALDLAFARAPDGGTIPRTLRQEGALKVRLPAVHDGPLQAIVLNTAGGLTGGDRLELDVHVGAGAALCVSGQACEKLYKSAGGDATVTTRLSVAAGASLEWLMQPAILFDRSALARTVSADIAGDARLLAVEALVFGRTAMAEQVCTGRITETWRVRRDGKLIYADAFRLEDDIQGALARRFVLGGQAAMATLLYVAPDAAERCTDLRTSLAGPEVCAGAASAWNGVLAARLAAPDGYTLTRGLVDILARFRNMPLPRPWTV